MEAGEPLREDVPAGPSESAGFLADGTWGASAVRHQQVDLPGGLRAPQFARRALEEHFAAAIDRDLLASVELLTTELVSNAVRHGGAGEDEIVVLHLATAPGCLRVEVCDPGSGFEPGRPTPYGEGGYGLFLVSEVSSRWGVSHDEGNCAWFELDLAGQAEL
jgi:anti-sigma regulatory factor (Ser/Thr protein kinase)